MEFVMKEQGFETEVEFGKLQVCGDETYGFRPYQLLVSAIAVCSGGVLRKILEKKRLTYSNISLKTEIVRNEKKANCIEKINIHFEITGSGLTREIVGKCLKITRKNCSMVQSVEGCIEVTETFEIIEEGRKN